MVNVWLILVDNKFMLFKHGDEWGIVYECFTHIISERWNFMTFHNIWE